MAENKEKQYVSDNARLMAEWNHEKNCGLIPNGVSSNSNKKIWWKCDKGHEWQAVVSKRNLGQNCPICQGKQILSGFNDLATTHPELVQEWDLDKNIGKSPEAFSKGSETRVWWRCKFNHSWQAPIYSRTSGTGCPYCAKELQSSFPEKAVFYYIKKMYPEAIANYRHDVLKSLELDIFIPSLQIGIEYDGERWHRSIEKDLNKNQLCSELGIALFRIREPACPTLWDGRANCIIRENKKKDLDKTIKHLITEICKIDGIECTIDVNSQRDNVAILELLTSVEKENSIHKNPDLLNEWDYKMNGILLPSMVTIGSDRKVWWICSQGHSYQASISSKTRGRGCPVCSGKKVLKGFNDVQSKCPELAKDWDYTKNDIAPDGVAYGSDKKIYWVCPKGHSYQCSINNRRAGQACPICSNKKILIGFNDLATTHPELAQEWDYELNQIQPTEASSGSHKKVGWICAMCDHKWVAPIYNRTDGHGCPQCAKQKRSKNKD